MVSTTLAFLTVVAGAILLAAYLPDTTGSVVDTYNRVKKVVIPVAGVLGAWILIATGVWYLILFAAVGLAIMIWSIYHEVN